MLGAIGFGEEPAGLPALSVRVSVPRFGVIAGHFASRRSKNRAEEKPGPLRSGGGRSCERGDGFAADPRHARLLGQDWDLI